MVVVYIEKVFNRNFPPPFFFQNSTEKGIRCHLRRLNFSKIMAHLSQKVEKGRKCFR